jgi:hypothetical protein
MTARHAVFCGAQHSAACRAAHISCTCSFLCTPCTAEQQRHPPLIGWEHIRMRYIIQLSSKAVPVSQQQQSLVTGQWQALLTVCGVTLADHQVPLSLLGTHSWMGFATAHTTAPHGSCYASCHASCCQGLARPVAPPWLSYSHSTVSITVSSAPMSAAS